MRIDKIELSGSLLISSSLSRSPLIINDNQLYISPQGDIGIGTKTPTSKLAVTGDTSISGDMSSKTLGVGSCETRPSTISADRMCMWFDSINKVPMVSYCVNTTLARAWSSGGSLSTGRYLLAGAGTQNAGLAMGGNNFGDKTCTEEYNGTSWAAGGALITSRYSLAGAGTQNAGLAMGGTFANFCTEEYNGTSWSAGGALISIRTFYAAAGTQNEGLAMGGNSPVVSCTEEYNGTSWSAGGALITARQALAGAGTQNQALAVGGITNANFSCTEEYNGTSWAAGGGLITARRFLSGAGTQNSGLAFGGNPEFSCTEEYNGTSWSAGGALITGRQCSAGAGSQNAGLAIGGCVNTILSCTEEYNIPTEIVDRSLDSSYNTAEYPNRPYIAQTGMCMWFDSCSKRPMVSYLGYNSIGAWSAGGSLITCRIQLAGGGLQNDAFIAAGFTTTAPGVSCTEEYNGTSWSAGGSVITTRYYLAGAGTQNVGIIMGGTTLYSSQPTGATEEYNGTSWSAGGNLINGRQVLGGNGTQNDSVVMGGLTGGYLSCTEEYNGTSWATGGALVGGIRGFLTSTGTQNASLAFGGYGAGGGNPRATVEEYNGSNWASSNGLSIGRMSPQGFGSQNDTIATGGANSTSQYYNGLVWAASTSMIRSVSTGASAGNVSSGLVSVCLCSEEYLGTTIIIDCVL
jgi:hypothetical protein